MDTVTHAHARTPMPTCERNTQHKARRVRWHRTHHLRRTGVFLLTRADFSIQVYSRKRHSGIEVEPEALIHVGVAVGPALSVLHLLAQYVRQIPAAPRHAPPT